VKKRFPTTITLKKTRFSRLGRNRSSVKYAINTLSITQILNNFPTFDGTQRFITMFLSQIPASSSILKTREHVSETGSDSVLR
jgi:hypothetical protein